MTLQLQEAATIKAQARAALRAARSLMANKATPKAVGDALDALEGALLKTWSDLATEADEEATPAQEAEGADADADEDGEVDAEELLDALLSVFDDADEDDDAETPAQEAITSDEQRKAVFASLADNGEGGRSTKYRMAANPQIKKMIKSIKYSRKAIKDKKWPGSDRKMTKGEMNHARAGLRSSIKDFKSTVANRTDFGYSGAKGAYKAAGIGEASDADLSGDFIQLMERAVRQDSTIPVKIIAPGWGSSGHYSADVLRRDGPKVFRKGTKMFWNHQTATEEAARPEGDLHDLAGEFVSDAVWKDDGLYADAKVFGPYREAVNELAPHIGVSIRAMGKAKPGEAEGRKGNLIEQIVAAKSVDFVTTPGAGGKILELFESARRAPESTEVVDMGEVERLTEANAALEAEKATLMQECARLKEHILLGEARGVVAAALGKADLPDVTKTRLAEALAKNPPAKDGGLDADAYTAQITEAINAEKEYIGKIVGGGRIVGMGSAPAATTGAGLRESFKRLYRSQGRTDAEAERMADDAARGR